MHWFTGTVKELRAAEERGCLVQHRASRICIDSGRALAAKLPRHFVVPESDGPFAQVDDKPVPPWSADLTARHLGQAWGISTQEQQFC
jgi:TatD DNase family protein